MRAFTTDDIAIAILNWNGLELLKQFLPSVVDHSKGAKVYLIDNASQDNSISYTQEHFPMIQVIALSDNLGYAGGYNEGIKSIPESIICCLNSDIEVSPNWLEPILECFNTSEDVSIVQPKILDYKNTAFFEYAGAAGGFIDKYGYPYCRGRIFEAIEKDQGQYNDTTQIFWASGACLFIKTDRFKQLGGFDSDFFAHMEEIDLCWRAFNSDDKIMYTGSSTVYHVGGSTLSSSSPKKTFLNFRNSLFTLVKNSPNPLPLVFTRLVLDGIAGLRFLFKLQAPHFLAILKAHFSFYSHLNKLIKKRKTTPKKSDSYYTISSIVWEYFVKKRTKF